MEKPKDHVQEIVDKWHSIDDEIWAKIICMERNRRIAKAYARKHTINVNGSCQDYLDGTTLGLNSFENPDRDSKTSYIKQYIGEGVKIKIHQNGDILVKRLSRSNVYLHSSRPDGAARRTQQQQQQQPQRPQLKKSQSSSDVYALDGGTEFYGVVGPRRLKHALAPNGPRKDAAAVASSTSSGASSSRHQPPEPEPEPEPKAGGIQLQFEKVCRVFSMARFKQALAHESRRAIPDRARLQNMCVCVLSFVANDEKKLNLPAWIMVINMVALDLMSSEIGLVEPYDSVGPPASTQTGPRLASDAHNKSSECLSSGNYLDGPPGDDDEIEPYRKFNGAKSSNRLPLSRGNNSALGSAAHGYARPKFVSSENFYDINGARGEERARAGGKPSALGASKEANSDGELRNGARHQQVGGGGGGGGPTNAVEQLGSSLSSGFNSQHSSYQHESSSSSSSSSAASSNSKEPDGEQQTVDTCRSAKQRSKFRQMIFGHSVQVGGSQEAKKRKKKMSKEEQANEQQVVVKHAQARGKRPPKLPHGISNLNSGEFTSNEHEASESFVMMSEPIPIPAPPTSAGGSSGKANLILVSPTGLSPPTSKKLAPGPAPSERQEPQLKLPSGIPSHAQLAPPATRKHILRYLMSQHQRPAAAAPPLPPLRRANGAGAGVGLNRPLPGLPKCHERRSDESLYYSGLQARVPNHHPNHLLPPGHNKEAAAAAATARSALFLHRQQQLNAAAATQAPHITKSAINAILGDIKHSAQIRQQLATNQINRQQQQQQMKRGEEQADRLSRYLEARRRCQTVERQLQGELFEASSNLKSSSKFMRSLESLNRQRGGGGGGSQKPLSALLNHVGGFLKRSPKSSAKCS